jgi:hypothetical protein
MPNGQYAAMAIPVTAADFDTADALQLALQAPRPMRVSVQLRVPEGSGVRWQRSVYLDSTPRTVTVPLGDMRSIEGPKTQYVDITRVNTLLLVVDTVNATPGSAGECWVGKVSTARPAGGVVPTSGR